MGNDCISPCMRGQRPKSKSSWGKGCHEKRTRWAKCASEEKRRGGWWDGLFANLLLLCVFRGVCVDCMCYVTTVLAKKWVPGVDFWQVESSIKYLSLWTCAPVRVRLCSYLSEEHQWGFFFFFFFRDLEVKERPESFQQTLSEFSESIQINAFKLHQQPSHRCTHLYVRSQQLATSRKWRKNNPSARVDAAFCQLAVSAKS